MRWSTVLGLPCFVAFRQPGSRDSERGSGVSARLSATVLLQLAAVVDLADAPETFRDAVASLSAVRPRPELRFEPIPAPQRLAPWAYAWGLELAGAGYPSAIGRLVLLYDPQGQNGWDGTMRLVGFVRAELDLELAGDPLLAAVSWSWLADALIGAGAEHTALGGTVTQTSSTRFGAIAGPGRVPERTNDIELRASWTPRGDYLTSHAAAFCELMAVAAGLPPVGVATLGKRIS
jgi:Protein of unknown function (DUF3000)